MQKQNTLVLILKEQRLRSLEKNKEHFKEVDERQRWVATSEDNFFYIARTLPKSTFIEQELLRRDLTILRRAERDGYINVYWLDLMARKQEKGFAVFVNDVVRQVAKQLPHIYTNWNSDQEANPYSSHENNEIITVLKKPINISHTSNDPYFLSQNKIQRKYFNNGIKHFYSHIDGADKMSEDRYLEYGAIIHFLKKACSEGLIVVDWDRFFKLKLEQLKDTITQALISINKLHDGYANKSRYQLCEREVSVKLNPKDEDELELYY